MTRLFARIACILLSLSSAALAQTPGGVLVCPGSSEGEVSGCKAFHYHLQAWRPDTKTFVELFGLNSYSTVSACESARTAQMKGNLAVVDFIHRADNNPNFQPNRVGPCHCDMTLVPSNPNFLTDTARASQIRTAEEISGKVKEKLLSEKLTPDSDLVQSLSLARRAGDISWNKTLSTPDPAAVARIPALPLPEEQIKDTAVATEGLRPAGGATELMLVEVPIPTGVPASRPATPPAPAPATASGASVEVEAAPPPASSASTTAAPSATGAPATSDPAAMDTAPADDEAVDRFIEYETARVQAVLKANDSITDDSLKGQIFAASMQRLQLLSNLRAVIEGAGAKSKLGLAARRATNEESRLAFVSRVFGPSMIPHWAPRDAAQILVTIPPGVTDDPVAVLRDSSGRYSADDKHLALFAHLARSASLTPNEELWLAGVIEPFF